MGKFFKGETIMGQIHVTGKRLLLKIVDNNEKKTPSGLILVGDQKPSDTGIVVGIGPQYEGPLKVNDLVLYDRNAGTKIQGGVFLIVMGDDVLCKVEK